MCADQGVPSQNDATRATFVEEVRHIIADLRTEAEAAAHSAALFALADRVSAVHSHPQPPALTGATEHVNLKTRSARGGRPPDMEEAAFLQVYWDAYQKILDQKRRDGDKLPQKMEVAAEMLMHRKTLTRNLRRYHLPWPPLSPH